METGRNSLSWRLFFLIVITVLFKKLFGRSKACYSFWANNIIVTANIATGKNFFTNSRPGDNILFFIISG
jgi:hypothetical protein